MSVSFGQAVVHEARLYPLGFRKAIQLLLGVKIQREDCSVD